MQVPAGLLTKANIKKAAAKLQREGSRGGFGGGRLYEVQVGARYYPVKAIVAGALELAGYPPLTPYDIRSVGGGRWHGELDKLGFPVRQIQQQKGAIPDPAPVTVAELVDVITGLGEPVAITKNKKESSASNFRIDPDNCRRWLDGYWPVPGKIEPGKAFVLHWVVHQSVVCIGRYRGSLRDGTQNAHSLILDKPHFYLIENFGGNSVAHATLKAILQQNGPVQISYYWPGTLTTDGRPAKERSRIVQARLEQPAFKKAVMARYNHRCVVTNCATRELLDAAHLPGRDWRMGHNGASDGIPLRADVHRALDNGLIELDENHRLKSASESLNGIYDEFLVQPVRRSRRI